MHLIAQELKTAHPGFQEEFQKLSHAYLTLHAKHQQLLKAALEKLYHQYRDLPIDQFLSFVKELNLHSFMEHKEEALTLVDEKAEQNITGLLGHFQKSVSLSELNHLVTMACKWLSLDFIKNLEELKKHEQGVRNQLLKELERFVLSPEEKILTEEREWLEKILSRERLIREEERGFFLKAFDEALSHVAEGEGH